VRKPLPARNERSRHDSAIVMVPVWIRVESMNVALPSTARAGRQSAPMVVRAQPASASLALRRVGVQAAHIISRDNGTGARRRV
jgi:hypothetical protein